MKDYLFNLTQNRAFPFHLLQQAPWRSGKKYRHWLLLSRAGYYSKEIVRNSVKECKVFIVANDTANVINILTTGGIADPVRFVNTAFTPSGCAITDLPVYRNDADSLYLIDWTYNRPRPSDDQVPSAIEILQHIPIYEATSPPFDWAYRW